MECALRQSAVAEEAADDFGAFVVADREREVNATIDDAVKFADESPEPSMDELGKGVYASEKK